MREKVEWDGKCRIREFGRKTGQAALERPRLGRQLRAPMAAERVLNAGKRFAAGGSARRSRRYGIDYLAIATLFSLALFALTDFPGETGHEALRESASGMGWRARWMAESYLPLPPVLEGPGTEFTVLGGRDEGPEPGPFGVSGACGGLLMPKGGREKGRLQAIRAGRPRGMPGGRAPSRGAFPLQRQALGRSAAGMRSLGPHGGPGFRDRPGGLGGG
jgi:hypothetical protein